jgi:hypothetical protein
MMFKNSLILLIALSCVDVEQFGTLVGDKSQKLGDKSQQPSRNASNHQKQLHPPEIEAAALRVIVVNIQKSAEILY